MTDQHHGMVERTGRVFRFGDHVDGKGKKFSLTREQFEAANPPDREVEVGFDPVRKGHYEASAFDGKLGHASRLRANGDYIDAEFALHPLLNEAIVEQGLGMSAIFGIKDKVLRRIDVADRARVVIPEAAFFAEDDSDEVAIFADEPLYPPGLDAAEEDDELTKEELAHHMHEVLAAGFPGLCDPGHRGDLARFCSGDKNPAHLIALHDFTLHHGATCSGMGHSAHAKFAHEGDYPVAHDEETEVQAPDNTALLARLDALEKQNQAQAAQLKAERDRRITGEAASFARDHAAVLPPTSQALFAGLYSTLADVADSSGTVEFAYGKDQAFKGSALDLLKSAVAQLKPHGLGLEKSINKDVEDAKKKLDGVVHFANDDAAKVSPNKPTPAGQAPSAERLAYLNSLNN